MCLGVSSDGDQLGKPFLQNRGFKVYTVRVERRDWFRVGRSLLSRDYWSGKCTVDPGYRYACCLRELKAQAVFHVCGTSQQHQQGK